MKIEDVKRVMEVGTMSEADNKILEEAKDQNWIMYSKEGLKWTPSGVLELRNLENKLKLINNLETITKTLKESDKNFVTVQTNEGCHCIEITVDSIVLDEYMDGFMLEVHISPPC